MLTLHAYLQICLDAGTTITRGTAAQAPRAHRSWSTPALPRLGPHPAAPLQVPLSPTHGSRSPMFFPLPKPLHKRLEKLEFSSWQACTFPLRSAGAASSRGTTDFAAEPGMLSLSPRHAPPRSISQPHVTPALVFFLLTHQRAPCKMY